MPDLSMPQTWIMSPIRVTRVCSTESIARWELLRLPQPIWPSQSLTSTSSASPHSLPTKLIPSLSWLGSECDALTMQAHRSGQISGIWSSSHQTTRRQLNARTDMQTPHSSWESHYSRERACVQRAEIEMVGDVWNTVLGSCQSNILDYRSRDFRIL